METDSNWQVVEGPRAESSRTTYAPSLLLALISKAQTPHGPGLRDAALKEYCDWQHSQVRDRE